MPPRNLPDDVHAGLRDVVRACAEQRKADVVLHALEVACGAVALGVGSPCDRGNLDGAPTTTGAESETTMNEAQARAKLIALGHSADVADGLLRNAVQILTLGHAGDPNMPIDEVSAPKLHAVLRAYMEASPLLDWPAPSGNPIDDIRASAQPRPLQPCPHCAAWRAKRDAAPTPEPAAERGESLPAILRPIQTALDCSKDHMPEVVYRGLSVVIDNMARALSAPTRPGEDIDPEDLWTDYRTERTGLGSAHRLAFLAGVDAGRRTAVDATRPHPGPAWDGLLRAARGAMAVLPEHYDARHRLARAVAQVDRVRGLVDATRPLAPDDDRCSDCAGTGWYLGDGAKCEKCGGTGKEPGEDERTQAERWALTYEGEAQWAERTRTEVEARIAAMLPLVREARAEIAAIVAEIPSSVIEYPSIPERVRLLANIWRHARDGWTEARAEIDRLRATPAPLTETDMKMLAPVLAAQRTPWPIYGVLVKLADAADVLLSRYSCDLHGYETVMGARDSARAIVAATGRDPSDFTDRFGVRPRGDIHAEAQPVCTVHGAPCRKRCAAPWPPGTDAADRSALSALRREDTSPHESVTPGFDLVEPRLLREPAVAAAVERVTGWRPTPGARVVTAEKLTDAFGDDGVRRPNAPGAVFAKGAQWGWWVQHDDGTQAPYNADELRPA